MKYLRILGLALAVTFTADAAMARPALWSFVGATDRSQASCLDVIYEACTREFSGCNRTQTNVHYYDSNKVIWSICHNSSRLNVTAFSVVGTSERDGDALKQIIQRFKDYIDRNM